MQKTLKEIFWRLDFLTLVLILLLINLPYFRQAYVPTHDTMCAFQFFYFFYNQFAFHHEIAQWMPYDSFGLPSNHEQLSFITPVSYLISLIGYFFHSEDVLFLFKCSIVLQELIFLLGMYLLSRLIFQRRITTFIVCLGSLSSGADLYYQWSYYFGIFYMLPMTAYFLLRFFQQRQPEFLWAAGLTVMFWETGEILYHISLWFFILTIICFVYWNQDKGIGRCLLKRSWTNAILFLILLSIILGFYVHLKDLLTHVVLRSRDEGAHNSLGMFLTWSGIYDMGSFLHWEIFNRPVGLFTLVFFIFSLINVKSLHFFAFVSVSLALLWLSFGGIFAIGVYFFPLMSYYRHIGYTYHLIHILFLIVAGLGVDHFWSVQIRTKASSILLILLILVFMVDAFGIPGEWITNHYTKEITTGRSLLELLRHIELGDNFWRLAGYALSFAGIFLTALFLWIDNKRKKGTGSLNQADNMVKVFLLLAVLLDAGLFQYSTLKKTKPLSDEYRPFLDIFRIHEMQFQTQRTLGPNEDRQNKGMLLLTRPDSGAVYNAAYSFLQYDPCYSKFETHMLPLGFNRLLKTRQKLDSDLLMVLGCNTPKLRLMSGAVFTNTVPETIMKMRLMPKLYDTLILRGVKENLKESLAAEPFRHLPGHLEVQKFSANELMANVDVENPHGAWLIYVDSYHPGWHAMVNGRKTPIYEAYLAFKAIRLDKGKNHIRFYFHNGLTTFLSYYIAIFGVVMSMVFFILFFGVLWGKKNAIS